MRWMDVFRLSFGNVLRGRLRSLLTVCSISIGVVSVLLVLSIGEGSRSAIAGQLDKIGLEGMMVYPKQSAVASGITLSGEDANDLITNVEGIDKAMPVMIRYGSYRIKNWQGNALLYGIDTAMRDILNVDLLYGRLPNRLDIGASKDVAIVGESFARMVYKRGNIVGKTIRLYIGTAFRDFEIIGIIASQQDSLSQLLGQALPEFIYIPYTAAMRLTGEKAIDEIIIGADDDEAAEKAVSYLNGKYRKGNSFRFENINGIRDKVDAVIRMIALFIGAIAAISIVVAGIGIMNTMISIAIERRHEIGVYLTLGATGRDILLSFLSESAILSAFGGILGIAAVIIPLKVTEGFTGIQFPLHVGYVVLSETVAVLCGILFGVCPALRASGMNPIDAIRSD